MVAVGQSYLLIQTVFRFSHTTYVTDDRQTDRQTDTTQHRATDTQQAALQP